MIVVNTAEKDIASGIVIAADTADTEKAKVTITAAEIAEFIYDMKLIKAEIPARTNPGNQTGGSAHGLGYPEDHWLGYPEDHWLGYPEVTGSYLLTLRGCVG